nr:hypothetical protein [Tanacetum cinerariifolium]
MGFTCPSKDVVVAAESKNAKLRKYIYQMYMSAHCINEVGLLNATITHYCRLSNKPWKKASLTQKEYTEVLRRVRCVNTLTILLPFTEEQAELKVFSDVQARNSISPKGATKGSFQD